MRAFIVVEMFEVASAILVLLVSRRRVTRVADGEQTGGRRFGAMRVDESERRRRGVRLPSERAGGVRAPPVV